MHSDGKWSDVLKVAGSCKDGIKLTGNFPRHFTLHQPQCQTGTYQIFESDCVEALGVVTDLKRQF